MPNEPQSRDTRVDGFLKLRTNRLRSNGKPVSPAPWVDALALTLAPLLAAATSMTHFDLNQEGDSALVRIDGSDGSPRSIPIDTGRAGKEGQGATLVLGGLAKRGVAKLDRVIVTHLDAPDPGRGDDSRPAASDGPDPSACGRAAST
jgi:beta-lactamase superfamily II metal-dependent hydrolase